MNTNTTNDKFRSFSIGARVTVAEKKKYQETAAKHNMTVSEFLSSLLQMFHNEYENYGKPSARELELEQEIRALQLEIKKLKKNSKIDFESAQFFKSQSDKVNKQLMLQKEFTKLYKSITQSIVEIQS